MPQIRQNGAVKQFFVDDKPFIMLSGELHNSSASSIEYMQPIWDKLSALHLNTVIGTASWELVEPEEGKFDFSLVDDANQRGTAAKDASGIDLVRNLEECGVQLRTVLGKSRPKAFPAHGSQCAARWRH